VEVDGDQAVALPGEAGTTLCQKRFCFRSRSSRVGEGSSERLSNRSWPGLAGRSGWSRTGRGVAERVEDRLSLVDLDAAQDVRAGTRKTGRPGSMQAWARAGGRGPLLQSLARLVGVDRAITPRARAAPVRTAWVIRSTSGLRPSTRNRASPRRARFRRSLAKSSCGFSGDSDEGVRTRAAPEALQFFAFTPSTAAKASRSELDACSRRWSRVEEAGRPRTYGCAGPAGKEEGKVEASYVRDPPPASRRSPAARWRGQPRCRHGRKPSPVEVLQGGDEARRQVRKVVGVGHEAETQARNSRRAPGSGVACGSPPWGR